MFEANYSAEKSIKMWAKFFYYVAIALPILAMLTFFVFLCVDAEDLWWIGLIVVGGSLISAIAIIFSSHIIWGFSEIISGVRKMSRGISAETEQTNESDLPEL